MRNLTYSRLEIREHLRLNIDQQDLTADVTAKIEIVSIAARVTTNDHVGACPAMKLAAVIY